MIVPTTDSLTEYENVSARVFGAKGNVNDSAYCPAQCQLSVDVCAALLTRLPNLMAMCQCHYLRTALSLVNSNVPINVKIILTSFVNQISTHSSLKKRFELSTRESLLKCGERERGEMCFFSGIKF